MNDVVIYVQAARGERLVEVGSPESCLVMSALVINGKEYLFDGDIRIGGSTRGFLALELTEPLDEGMEWTQAGWATHDLADIMADLGPEFWLEGTNEDLLILPLTSITILPWLAEADRPGAGAA